MEPFLVPTAARRSLQYTMTIFLQLFFSFLSGVHHFTYVLESESLWVTRQITIKLQTPAKTNTRQGKARRRKPKKKKKKARRDSIQFWSDQQCNNITYYVVYSHPIYLLFVRLKLVFNKLLRQYTAVSKFGGRSIFCFLAVGGCVFACKRDHPPSTRVSYIPCLIVSLFTG